MATAITTVTKTASVVKTTKGSEKKWSEILTLNRRHDLQLPLDIAKYDTEFKRTYNLYQRQQTRTERSWAHKHQTWYQDDYLFRNRLLTQLKPITRRFKHVQSLSPNGNDDDHENENDILNPDEMEVLTMKKPALKKELPALKRTKKKPLMTTLEDRPRRNNQVLSKLVCSKMLQSYEPRLYSHHHAPFLDIAQRFIKHKPEGLEKGANNNERQKQQKKYLKNLIENEQERTRLAAMQFKQRLEDEKNKETNGDDSDDDDYDYYS